MNGNRFRKSNSPIFTAMRTTLLPVAMFVLVIYLFGAGLDRINSTAKAESLRHSQMALSRAVTACYAIEGRYPPNVAYMRAHYGLAIDEGDYIIHYNRFAANIAPEMWVQERYF